MFLASGFTAMVHEDINGVEASIVDDGYEILVLSILK